MNYGNLSMEPGGEGCELGSISVWIIGGQEITIRNSKFEFGSIIVHLPQCEKGPAIPASEAVRNFASGDQDAICYSVTP
jgi:hypothetical protein